MMKILTMKDLKKLHKREFAISIPMEKIRESMSEGKTLSIQDSSKNELGHTCEIYLNGEKIGTIAGYE